MFFEEGNKIARMQAIAHLIAVAAEAEIFEWALAQPRIDPVGEDALISAAKLASSREHAAAIDENGKVEGFAVF